MWRASLLLAIDAMTNGRTKPDFERSFYWCQIANLQGGEDASRATRGTISLLSKKLPRSDMDEISSFATNWFKEHSVPLQVVLSTHDNNGKPFSFALAQPEAGFENGRIVMISPDNRSESHF